MRNHHRERFDSPGEGEHHPMVNIQPDADALSQRVVMIHLQVSRGRWRG